jgi:hypothetical protein
VIVSGLALGLLALACRADRGGDSSSVLGDLDGDGFEMPDDCADDDAAIHPAADEHCDGVDNNCDGELDGADAIEATAWYADADADGFGNPHLVRIACEAPNEFFLDNADDCDDEREDVFPGAQEYCDGIDDDCDGATDEEDALDQQLVYVDADGDGAGDPDATSMQCGVPDGFAAEPNDCDDGNAAMNPYLPEICNDGLDNDCEGTAEPCGFEGEKDLMLAEAIIVGAEDDQLGLGMASGDLDGDGDLDLAVRGGAVSFTSSSRKWIYLLDGPVAGLVDAPTVALAQIEVQLDTVLYGPVGDALEVFDVDGDGYDDLVAGSTGGGGATRGIFVFLSPFSGAGEPADADAAITDNNVGGSLERAGDLDGDGEVDFLVANTIQDVVYVVPGPIDRDLSTETVEGSITSPCPTGGHGGCGFGAGLGTSGDLDGDGHLDVVVGAPYHSLDSYSYEGAAYVYAGPFDSAREGEDHVAQFVSTSTYRALGTVIDIVPDLDGDGYDDLLFGHGSNAGYLSAPSDPGLAGVFYGPVADELSPSDADFLFEGEGGDATGISVALADTNDDGVQDLVVGDAWEDGTVPRAGAVFAVEGPLGTGTVGTDAAVGRVVGTGPDFAGSLVKNLGDLNDDGVDDVGIGAPTYQATAGGQGAAYLVFGGGM